MEIRNKDWFNIFNIFNGDEIVVFIIFIVDEFFGDSSTFVTEDKVTRVLKRVTPHPHIYMPCSLWVCLGVSMGCVDVGEGGECVAGPQDLPF